MGFTLQFDNLTRGFCDTNVTRGHVAGISTAINAQGGISARRLAHDASSTGC